MDTLIAINNLPLNKDVIHTLINRHVKYDMYIKEYKKHFNKTIDHIQYYMWLNIKINKKDGLSHSLLHTIREFDYYKRKYRRAKPLIIG